MQNDELLEKLKWKMIEWEHGCPKRIQHFLKVNSFAVTIAKGEGVDEHTLFLLADACVNMYEKDVSDEAKLAMLKNVFRTETGRKIYTTMFDIELNERD